MAIGWLAAKNTDWNLPRACVAGSWEISASFRCYINFELIAFRKDFDWRYQTRPLAAPVTWTAGPDPSFCRVWTQYRKSPLENPAVPMTRPNRIALIMCKLIARHPIYHLQTLESPRLSFLHPVFVFFQDEFEQFFIKLPLCLIICYFATEILTIKDSSQLATRNLQSSANFYRHITGLIRVGVPLTIPIVPASWVFTDSSKGFIT